MTFSPETERKKIDDYIISQPEKMRACLEMIRQTIRNTAPSAEEAFSYRMPSFRLHGMLVYYAAFTNHCSLFVNPEVLSVFKPRISGCSFTKSAIKFPADRPLPEEMLVEILRYAVKRNLEKKQLKDKTKIRSTTPVDASG